MRRAHLKTRREYVNDCGEAGRRLEGSKGVNKGVEFILLQWEANERANSQHSASFLMAWLPAASSYTLLIRQFSVSKLIWLRAVKAPT